MERIWIEVCEHVEPRPSLFFACRHPRDAPLRLIWCFTVRHESIPRRGDVRQLGMTQRPSVFPGGYEHSIFDSQQHSQLPAILVTVDPYAACADKTGKQFQTWTGCLHMTPQKYNTKHSCNVFLIVLKPRYPKINRWIISFPIEIAMWLACGVPAYILPSTLQSICPSILHILYILTYYTYYAYYRYHI